VTILSAGVSIFAFRFRSRASLELELVALRHQVTVLRRQWPGRPQLSSLDRLQPSHGWKMDGVASEGPLPDLAELSAQPPARHCGD
jgi:hypothetical protein